MIESKWMIFAVFVSVVLLIAIGYGITLVVLVLKGKQQQKRFRKELVERGVLRPGDMREITPGFYMKLMEEQRQQRIQAQNRRQRRR